MSNSPLAPRFPPIVRKILPCLSRNSVLRCLAVLPASALAVPRVSSQKASSVATSAFLKSTPSATLVVFLLKHVSLPCFPSFFWAHVPPLVARVSREKDRLESEKDKAEEDLMEALSRLRRLRRQEKHLREQAAEMIRRGCEDLDELEEAQRLEVQSLVTSQNEALSEIQLLEDHGVIDWSSLVPGSDFAFSGVDPSNIVGASSGRSGDAQ